MGEIPNPPISLNYYGGLIDKVRNWAKLQQQKRLILVLPDHGEEQRAMARVNLRHWRKGEHLHCKRAMCNGQGHVRRKTNKRGVFHRRQARNKQLTHKAGRKEGSGRARD